MQFLHAVHGVVFNIFTINVGIDTYFIYFHGYLKDVVRVKFGTHTETKI